MYLWNATKLRIPNLFLFYFSNQYLSGKEGEKAHFQFQLSFKKKRGSSRGVPLFRVVCKRQRAADTPSSNAPHFVSRTSPLRQIRNFQPIDHLVSEEDDPQWTGVMESVAHRRQTARVTTAFHVLSPLRVRKALLTYVVCT